LTVRFLTGDIDRVPLTAKNGTCDDDDRGDDIGSDDDNDVRPSDNICVIDDDNVRVLVYNDRLPSSYNDGDDNGTDDTPV
jgi:hypothetical protein